MHLTPGIRLLLSSSHILALPLLTFAIGHFLSSEFDLDVPLVLLTAVALAVVPLNQAVKVATRRRKERRDAAASGARLVPTCQGNFPGNLDIMLVLLKANKSGYIGDGFSDLLEKYGPAFNFGVLGEDMVFTTSPDHIKAVLATNFENFVKGPSFDFSMHSVLGSGVFNSDGEMWKFHRGLTRPHFNREKITDFDIFDHHVKLTIEKMKGRLRQGYAVDIQDLLGRFTVDTATEFLFGSSVDTLSSDLPYPHGVNIPRSVRTNKNPSGVDPDAFAKAFVEAQDAVADRERIGWSWPLLEFVGDRTTEPMETVNRFVEPIVEEAVKKYAAEKADIEAKKELTESATLLEHLVNFTSDPTLLKDETLNILLAGRDTTAATLTFAIHFLAKYPELTKRLREEILSKVGPTERPTFENIKDMKYLRAFINETLRLYPVVPFNIRTSINACLLPSPDPAQAPIYVPPNTKVSYSVYLMHRRKELWGPDAEEFDPDRFLDERLHKYLIKNNFIFLPFNAGPRICLGQQMSFLHFFLASLLLQSFSGFTPCYNAAAPENRAPASWALEPGRKGKDNIRPQATLTLSVKGGLWVEGTMIDA